MEHQVTSPVMEERITEAKPYQVKDLGIADPDILLVGNDDWCLYAYPARKAVLAACSTAFATRFATKTMEDEIPNDCAPPFNHLPVLKLDESPKTIRNVLLHLFPEPAIPANLKTEELIAVYRASHKYGIKRLYDWMRDKLLWTLPNGTSLVHLRLYAAASSIGDRTLALKSLETLVARHDWRLDRDKENKWLCTFGKEVPQSIDLTGDAAANLWEYIAKGKTCRHCNEKPFDL